MVQLVMPLMRKDRSGKIVNISSMGGRVTTPFGGWYYASKFAVEGFSNSLRMKAQHFGIDVILIEPGIVKSEWSNIATERLNEASLGGVYEKSAGEYEKKMLARYSKEAATFPKVIAETIGKAVTARKPKTRYLVGYCAKLCVYLHSIIGDKAYDKFIQRVM